MTVEEMSFYKTNFAPAWRRALAALALGCAMLMAGCVATSGATKGDAATGGAPSDHITVEGRAVVMGNVPFTALMLQTEDRNSYILKMDAEERAELMTPARVRVSGVLYLDDWNGRPYAHIRVLKLTEY